MQETIYALSTPKGPSGVAIIRVSGPEALSGLVRLTSYKKAVITPRKALFTKFLDPTSSRLIDRGLALYFKAPESFTGEDVVEYQIHGSRAVISCFLEVFKSFSGYRMADPGEFTRRAFENGKLDLTEAEAIADLIHAETELQREQALSQMEGALSFIYNSWGDRLKESLAHLEADLEFPDEDLPQGVWPEVFPVLEGLYKDIIRHMDDGRRGEILREGIKIVVVGAPNAGKSSLVNALARRDVAIVSEYAGTTRDVIECHLDLGGYPVVLSDTAGLRPDQLGETGQGGIEQEGIRRALVKAEEADIRLVVFDATTLPAFDLHSFNLLNDKTIAVLNKSDLMDTIESHINGFEAVCISATTGQGFGLLMAAILQKSEALAGTSDAPALTRQRHRDALFACCEHLKAAFAQTVPELVVEDVRQAMRDLGRITGRVDVEQLLDIIFNDFCIGK